MSVTYEKPKITKSDSHTSDSVETHPAYGHISANRVSGRAYLYGSDFEHQNYVNVSIRRSELHRGLSRDWPSARDELIEVALSEAQWATFVSAMNIGFGPQCTIQHIDRQMVPQIPHTANTKAKFKVEMNENLAEAGEAITVLEQKINESKLSEKAKKDLLWQVTVISRSLGGSAEFIGEQFGEYIENVTEHAKIEVNAYTTMIIQRTGLTALGATQPIMLLGDEKP